MKYNFNCKVFVWFYHNAMLSQKDKSGLDKNTMKAVKKECIDIIKRAKDIGPSKLLGSYVMASYFIALDRKTGLTTEENFKYFHDGLFSSKLFHKAMGNAESYLSPKNMKWRKEWERKSHLKQYENDWVVDVLDKTDTFELGYNYHECGVCKLCKDENCFNLAKYLCKLDFDMADMMGLKLERTKTLADGGDFCDFRYSRKN